VNALSENAKLRFDHLAGQGSQAPSGTGKAATNPEDDTSQVDEAESAMRKALGLLGESPRHRPDTDRMDQPSRGSDRFGGGLHRRRFVQDGDVPVTVLRREPAHDTPVHRAAAAPAVAPSSSRLQRTEAALAAETAGREKAERALADLQATLHDLQTKTGHAELTKGEAVSALKAERESVGGLQSEIDALKMQLTEAETRAEDAEASASEANNMLTEERQARKSLEKLLRAAEAAREDAEQHVRSLSQEPSPAPVIETAFRQKVAVEPEVVPVPRKRGRPPGPRAVVVQEAEPEPVKWWLAPTKTVMKRR
jgi:DNA repair exonuclease SbcCD ATPase subunit